MKKIFLILVAIAWSTSSCEKDDICDAATATTPRLIIEFYDITNPSLTKNVANLAILGEGSQQYLGFNGVSKITVPLKTTSEITRYKFILNYGNTVNPEVVNEDNLEFHYTHSTIFVSRACGYKTIFTLDAQNPYILTDAAAPDGLWIKNITLAQPNILNENETHLKISF